MAETNRERLKRLGITYEKAFADAGEELCRFCPDERFRGNIGCISTPDGAIMCEGRWCDCAFEDWLDDLAGIITSVQNKYMARREAVPGEPDLQMTLEEGEDEI